MFYFYDAAKKAYEEQMGKFYLDQMYAYIHKCQEQNSELA